MPPSQPSSAGQADRAVQPEQSPPQPGGGATAQPEEPSARSEGQSAPAESPPAEPSAGNVRAAPPTPRRASRRKSQADARSLEREYLEGELDALGEKEQEEVGLLSLTGHDQTVLMVTPDRQVYRAGWMPWGGVNPVWRRLRVCLVAS